ncbi:four-helix bundle copper-binding protein [Sandaracinus amylolyticus]|uniref:four-helix bundle copper-binding protein n=1 Tax=Sandaracinus amylolyticus TaxID=927083 RepID=UPI001F2AF76B|nr:four-helix bundle copper-binding protein [Sandaracinus amylolyticus]UJR86070.1 Hypothetical protein I5071_81510 [Sandaracinus amylolyticus]
METTARMLEMTPGVRARSDRTLLACIDACFECAQVCTLCANACLQERTVAMLRQCIRLDLDCADVCDATGRVLARVGPHGTRMARMMVEACAIACAECARECEQHADVHEHCRLCAETCRRCERACRALLAS